jgi:hypothetical protein
LKSKPSGVAVSGRRPYAEDDDDDDDNDDDDDDDDDRDDDNDDADADNAAAAALAADGTDVGSGLRASACDSNAPLN